ncbi:hypothetical protein [Micromonospora sp. DT47]|uniref:hypothetical protein n=1 Tax=Micromonospora sp. DT47 TaxID=3393431 RepID=UPI003CF816F5
MTDQPTDTTPMETPAVPAPAQDPATAPTKPETDWKAEARKWEQRAKENSSAAKKLTEFEEAQKTEAQKLADRATAAEKAAAAKDADLLRLRTALKHGISDEDAETFLTGADEESLTRQAERLAALRGPSGPRTPAPDPSQGARSSAGPTQLTRDHLRRMSPEQIEDARVKGQLNDLLGVK